MKTKINLYIIKLMAASTLITALLLTMALISGYISSGTEVLAGPMPGGTGG